MTKRIATMDTETTGVTLPSSANLADQPKIIELGVVLIENCEKIGEYNWLINPCELITEIITKITGITNDDLADKLTFAEQLDEFKEVFEGVDIMICHNAPFDTALLRYDLMRAGCEDFPWPKQIICSVQEYYPIFGHRPRLIELYEYILGKPLAQTHRAVDDALALYECLKADGYFEMLELEN